METFSDKCILSQDMFISLCIRKKALWLNEHYFKDSSARILNILGDVHNVDQNVYKSNFVCVYLNLIQKLILGEQNGINIPNWQSGDVLCLDQCRQRLKCVACFPGRDLNPALFLGGYRPKTPGRKSQKDKNTRHTFCHILRKHLYYIDCTEIVHLFDWMIQNELKITFIK